MELKKILLIAPAWVGDFVMANSLMRILQNQETDCVIDVVAPAWTAPLGMRMPEVNELLILNIGHGVLGLATRWKLGYKLRDRHYQQAFILPNSFKSALVPFIAHTALRTGYLGEMRWGLINDVRRITSGRTIDQFVALGLTAHAPLPEIFPLPRLIANIENAHVILNKLAINPTAKPILALCPGAEYGSAKRWPPKYFAEVARYFGEHGWQVWLFGSERDATITKEIKQVIDKNYLYDFAGRLSLAESVDVLALSNVVVSNDSGLMHVAAALDLPVIALFGSSDPYHTPPLSKKALILYQKLPCSPCFKRDCPHRHLNCLNDLTPLDVINAILRISVQ